MEIPELLCQLMYSSGMTEKFNLCPRNVLNKTNDQTC
jgi:hypothetical protein